MNEVNEWQGASELLHSRWDEKDGAMSKVWRKAKARTASPGPKAGT